MGTRHSLSLTSIHCQLFVGNSRLPRGPRPCLHALRPRCNAAGHQEASSRSLPSLPWIDNRSVPQGGTRGTRSGQQHRSPSGRLQHGGGSKGLRGGQHENVRRGARHAETDAGWDSRRERTSFPTGASGWIRRRACRKTCAGRSPHCRRSPSGHLHRLSRPEDHGNSCDSSRVYQRYPRLGPR